ncbi:MULTISPECIES: hypothetical protein [unclassified Marinobacterium]|uniref:hypothetical protein n=1 Tax=unclassified Marinobacterium TaxID=2644139 RepID=UPI001567D33C|nr:MULTISPECIES: hypothetical protein [unclassified Marinobacterium]NRP47424.1 hypothetical protein [Marinobacterium sp. xm-d-543]NRQ23475.1 hypothetical protein [Marinobacterium sp. xm-m-312]
MNSVSESQQPLNIDQQVDLLEYLDAILKYKYRLILVALIVSASLFIFSKLLDERFTASGVAAININEKPGGVSPENYIGSDALGLLEHDFILDAAPSNQLDRLLSKLGAYEFNVYFINRFELLPMLFPEKWDSATSTWIDGFKVDYRVAVKNLQEKHMGYSHDEKSGLLTIYATSNSPELSADLVNNYVISFNDFIKARSVDSMNARRTYLEKRLTEVNNLEVQRSIYRLLEAQLGVESIIHARENYPLEPILPAYPPLFKSYPSGKKWTVLAFVGTLFLGIFFIIAMVIFRKLSRALKAYKPEVSESSVATLVNKDKETDQALVSNSWVD